MPSPLRLRRSGVYPLIKVSLAIAIIVIAVFGSFLALKAVLATDSPLMVVSSGSMIPTLNVGDIIVIKGAPPSTIIERDIIVFRSPRDPNTAIVHRVIGIIEHNGVLYFKTKGDNNPYPDDWTPYPGVPESHLIGVYVAKIPYVGLLNLRLRGPLGLGLIIMIAALMLALEYAEWRKRGSTGAH